jgi:hypothetical protein
MSVSDSGTHNCSTKKPCRHMRFVEISPCLNMPIYECRICLKLRGDEVRAYTGSVRLPDTWMRPPGVLDVRCADCSRLICDEGEEEEPDPQPTL